MNKTIIIVDGYSEGKNKFQEIIKGVGNYWCWNINASNFLSMLTHRIVKELEHDKKYYDFLAEFKDLTDRYFDFERVYTLEKIEKFLSEDNDKAQVLLIHGCTPKLALELQDTYENAFDLFIGNKEGCWEEEQYCKCLNYNDPSFQDNILSVMRILTK